MKSRRLMAAPRLRTGHRTNPRLYSGRGKAGGQPMSALGQKRTFALHQPMSALPPIATAKADFRLWGKQWGKQLEVAPHKGPGRTAAARARPTRNRPE